MSLVDPADGPGPPTTTSSRPAPEKRRIVEVRAPSASSRAELRFTEGRARQEHPKGGLPRCPPRGIWGGLQQAFAATAPPPEAEAFPAVFAPAQEDLAPRPPPPEPSGEEDMAASKACDVHLGRGRAPN